MVLARTNKLLAKQGGLHDWLGYFVIYLIIMRDDIHPIII